LVLISPIAGKPLLRLFHTFISPISKKAKEAIREGSFFCVMRKIHLDFTTLRNKCRSFMFFSEAIIVGVIDNQL